MRVKYKCEMACSYHCKLSIKNPLDYEGKDLRCIFTGSSDWTTCRTIANALKLGYLIYYKDRMKAKT